MMNNTNNLIEELADIYDFWHTPWWQTKIFYASLLFVVIIVFIVLIWYLIIKLRARKPLKPWDQALLDLNTLKNSPSFSHEETSALYFKMRAILKRYLVARYGTILLDKTDDELIHELSLAIEQGDIVEDIQDLLKQSALVIFAALSLPPESFFHALEKAISVVKRTLPQPIKK